ncbi:PREDICTED: zinc finger and BTB domain-containing protein 48-like isoform X2 [Poecilia mexicana]|uniref:zinc finger and BTB domain-containing protein 48-like isoform X2 n=1 Tax=Poecilia mexicana TaxID=48701 RepID=UPI00072DFBFB|nr:PREDICTED: zinc finger and BTB domain-containing protein 48-like isoform X2 [Poecilia mexicana]XP_014829044.1 PREDICTED: zinc finger and BTB domain-containing protein 48-like isoform X2 [Poecilia mexicana]
MPSAETSHAHRVLSSLNQQRAAGRFCDAVLNLGDGVLYQAHCNVLACFSDLFEVSISNPTQHTEFDLQGCPSDGLELLLSFVYSGELKLEVDNLQKVQQAATSLCVPEALALCQQFQVNSGNPVPLKRKRGRPKKGQTDAVKEENSLMVLAEESSSAGSFSLVDAAAAPTATTTTRSGRVVKGPKRLVTADASPMLDPKAVLTPVEKETSEGVVENVKSDQPAAESEVVELKIDTDPGSDGQEADGTAAEAEEAAQKRKLQSKTNNSKSNDGVEESSNKGSAKCPVCLKSFKSKYYLKVHNRRHTGEKPFACSKCGKRYFRKENLSVHESRGCARVSTYICSTCSLSFNTKEELRAHVVSHTGEMPHKCSTCNEQFMYKKNLTMHLMKVHGHPKPHACPQCPKTFLTRTELRVHEAAKHRGEKPFVCEECGHRASSRNGLQMHIKAIHRNERPFVCNICGHAFSQKNNLNMHLRVHSGERPYQCHLCGKTFRTQASLDKHHRTHTGERPYGCDICDWRFTEKGALLRHKASKHEEGRPHCCYMCNKTFKAQEQLRVHLQRHRGMRKFECTDCGYKFTRQAHLRRHVQIHKRTENYNPRQRKLRNLIVQEVDENPDESEATQSTKAQVAKCSPEPAASQQAANDDSSPGVGNSQDAVMEEATSNEERERSETGETFTELHQTQLVSDTFESTVDMEE